MIPRTVFAPGKLVLVGEYAVLDGGGAVVAAVDRGVSCTVSDGAGIVTPGDDSFVRAALGNSPGHYVFADWNPVDLGGMKPGFGGSAAATVAAVIAAGLPPSVAYTAHHAVQGGGSGVDIFASLLGGIRRFPDGAVVDVPTPLAVWSGESAQTGPRVKLYRAWPGRAAFVEESRALVAAYATDPVRVTREAYRLLRAMAAEAGLAYDTAAHARIAAIAETFGGAAKPSGAGGGDVAVAIVPDPEARARFAAAVAMEGLPAIPANVVPGSWDGPLEPALPCPPGSVV